MELFGGFGVGFFAGEGAGSQTSWQALVHDCHAMGATAFQGGADIGDLAAADRIGQVVVFDEDLVRGDAVQVRGEFGEGKVMMSGIEWPSLWGNVKLLLRE